MEIRHYRHRILFLACSILLFAAMYHMPAGVFAAEQASSDTEAFIDASHDEASAEALSEEARADLLAEELHQMAEQEEPAITAILQMMESDHAYLTGLEYRLKSVPSISRKLLLWAHEDGDTPEEEKTEINDVLRYTMIIEDPFYTEKTEEIVDSLIESGYPLIAFRNFWVKDKDGYKGINSNFITPGGMIFELQFHTPSSYETKEEKTHPYYEIMRDENASEEEKEEAKQKNEALFAMVPVPEGVRELSFDTFTQEAESVESAKEEMTEAQTQETRMTETETQQ